MKVVYRHLVSKRIFSVTKTFDYSRNLKITELEPTTDNLVIVDRDFDLLTVFLCVYGLAYTHRP